MPFINLSGYEVFYEKQGEGEYVLLMLPGSLGATRQEYAKQFEYFEPLSDKFTLVSWDAPGWGQSRPPERDYNDCYNRDAKLLIELMVDHLKIEKFNLLGFSDGSRTAIQIASSYPERVNKLVLLGATTFNSPKELKVFDLCRDVNGWSNERRGMFESLYGKDLQMLWAAWVDENRKLDDFMTPELSKITCQVLLLYGENDIIAPIDPHAPHMRKNLSRSRIHIFPKSSHQAHQDRTREFNKIVEKFIST
ncbi:Valacyclovir hydrolase [Sarcoptes scabiei]|uniref:Biphenyl hydrolase-like protein (Serine hydrolase)-like protein n=1 Tax=Sarcoptes scabiei TaxID=52283 RepID=A0A132A2Z2_SARSC|nr:Valacyclovir hydrolase [Sarcoptes scabiei]KPM04965.1 biphenyl hydrolase-like protein (serine hydrolase)-like protein [Sarcoptes scabiei]